jgi:pilus assembly protein CpaE
MTSSMTNLAEQMEAPAAPVETGDISEIRPIPRITLQAFCESEAVAQAIDAASRDRRMTRAHV